MRSSSYQVTNYTEKWHVYCEKHAIFLLNRGFKVSKIDKEVWMNSLQQYSEYSMYDDLSPNWKKQEISQNIDKIEDMLYL
jgi:hypothetical protein